VAPLALVLLMLAAGAHAAPAPTAWSDVPLERLVSLPTLSGTPPTSPAWAPDGEQLAFLWNDQGWPFRDVWVAPAEGGPPRRLTTMDPAAAAHAPFGEHIGEDRSLAALRAAAAERHAGGVSALVWSPDGERLVFIYRGDLYAVAVRGGEPELLAGGGGKSEPVFSPDGRYLSFMQGGDLWLLRLEGNYLARATQVGEPGIGTVPVGAFLGRDVEYRRHAWSADSRYIAMEYVDRRTVRRMPIPSYLHEEPILHEVRRAYPGDSDEIREVAIFHLADGRVRHLELDEPTNRPILTLAWSPVVAELLIEQDSYDGESRWIHVARANDGAIRQLLFDHRPRRIYALFASAWSSDGQRIIYVGDHEGYYRLYSMPAAGGRARLLTRGDFDVGGSGFSSATLEIAPRTRELFYLSSEHSPYELHVYRMPEGGGPAVRVSRLPGMHEELAVAPDGARVAVIASTDTLPAELYILDARGERAGLRVTDSARAEFRGLPLAEPRYVSFPSRVDDFRLHARIIEPPTMEPGKKYPVIIGNVYSGTARKQWIWPRPISLLQQRMVHDGEYIIVQVDLRGSVGYGVEFREAFQGDWGGGDLEDLHSTVEYLHTLPHVDPERIGIWGNSYGGMMVLFALFERPGLFAAGIAGSPAIDVHHFTQNDQHLARRPWTHPEIFQDSTLLNYGDKLEDPLLIIHGLHDDIVPFKTTVMMMEKLMLLGKDFDMIVPAESGHWWAYPEHYSVHTFRKFMQFFDRHVGPGGRP
jgi:dipeptidyl-peptidase 4